MEMLQKIIDDFANLNNIDGENEKREIETLAVIAEDVINSSVTIKFKVELLNEKYKQNYLKAIHSQLDYFYRNGGMDFINSDSTVGSVSLGSFSYGNKANESSNKSKSPIALCPLSRIYLEKIGFLYRGL